MPNHDSPHSIAEDLLNRQEELVDLIDTMTDDLPNIDELDQMYAEADGDEIIVNHDIRLSDKERKVYERYLRNSILNDGVEGIDQGNPRRAAYLSVVMKYESLSQELELIEKARTELSEQTDLSPNMIDILVEDYIIDIISDKLISYLSLAAELIEEYSILMLKYGLIAEDVRGSDKTERLIDRRTNQELREEWLYRTGIISAETKGKMAHARHLRNDMIHDLRTRQYLDSIENIESEVARVEEIVTDLYSRFDNIELFKRESDKSFSHFQA